MLIDGHVSPARVTQVMNLLLLAPEIQERRLFSLPAEREPYFFFSCEH